MDFRRCLAVVAVLATTACGAGSTIGSAPSEAGTSSGSAPGSPSPTPMAGSTAPHTATPVPTASATSSGAGGQSSTAVPFPAATDSDPFYAQPSPFPVGDAAGTILASRSVTYAPVGGVAMTNQAWELSFVSRDTNENPIAAIAVVVKPLTPAVGVAPLDAVFYAEDSLGAQCAPSHSVTGRTTNSVEQAEAPIALQGLTMGWTLVYPDTEGPQSAYGSGRLSGQIALDAIRAAERFAPLGLGASTPVVMTGYSGGAFPASWGATLQHEYAPQLHIVGIASGGTPANPEGIVQNIDTNQISNAAFFNLILSAVVGTNRSYPSLLAGDLNAKGVAAATSLENGCDGATSNGAAAPTGTLPDYTINPDPVHDAAAEALYPLITEPLAGNSPVTNVFVYHSQVDELIPIAGVIPMVDAWCAAGSPVEFYEGVTGDHVAFEASMGTLVYAYLASRINGTTTVVPPTSTTCNT
jgi:hypothetical protein